MTGVYILCVFLVLLAFFLIKKALTIKSQKFSVGFGDGAVDKDLVLIQKVDEEALGKEDPLYEIIKKDIQSKLRQFDTVEDLRGYLSDNFQRYSLSLVMSTGQPFIQNDIPKLLDGYARQLWKELRSNPENSSLKK